MLKTFVSKENEIELKVKGFTKIKFNNLEVIDNLRKDYEQLTPNENSNSYTSFEIQSTKTRIEIDNAIKSNLSAELKKFLPEFSPLWGNYMVKAPKSQNMELHADWAYVEEPNFISLNIWVPLQECDINNGTLWVVPYSHKIIKSIRGINLPRYYFKKNELLKKFYGVPLRFKKGEAIIYDHRLIHYSFPNFSATKRIAATLILTPKNAPVFFYWLNEKTNKIEKYLVKDPSFFCSTGFENPPIGIPESEIDISEIIDIRDSDILENLKKVNFIKRFFRDKKLKALQDSNLNLAK